MDLRKPILVTGAAGFIGFHIALKMLEAGWIVAGLDNINDYYDVRLKQDRLSLLLQYPGFKFFKLSLEDHSSIEELFDEYSFDIVAHMAAQAGVRYSLINPRAYIQSNIDGFSTCSRVAGTVESSIWSLPHRVPSMAQTRKSPSPCTITWTTRSPFMRPPRKQTN